MKRRLLLCLLVGVWFFSLKTNAQQTPNYRIVDQELLIESLNIKMGENELGVKKIRDFRDTLRAQIMEKFQMDCAIVERNVESGNCSPEQKKIYEDYLQSSKDSILQFDLATKTILDTYQNEQDANILFFINNKITFYQKQNNCKVIFKKDAMQQKQKFPEITQEILASVQSQHLSFIELIFGKSEEVMLSNIRALLPNIPSKFDESDYASIKNRWKGN